MRKYEIMYILKADLDEAGRNEAIEKLNAILEGKGAKVNKVDLSMGLRDLAYEINKESEGYYVLFEFTSETSFPAELDRIYKITDGILRSIIIKK